MEVRKNYNDCRGTLYEVKAGDTLYSISRKYKVPLAMILRANPYADIYNLQIGSKLCIPIEADNVVKPEAPAVPSKPSTSNKPATPNKPVIPLEPGPVKIPVPTTMPQKEEQKEVAPEEEQKKVVPQTEQKEEKEQEKPEQEKKVRPIPMPIPIPMPMPIPFPYKEEESEEQSSEEEKKELDQEQNEKKEEVVAKPPEKEAPSLIPAPKKESGSSMAGPMLRPVPKPKQKQETKMETPKKQRSYYVPRPEPRVIYPTEPKQMNEEAKVEKKVEKKPVYPMNPRPMSRPEPKVVYPTRPEPKPMPMPEPKPICPMRPEPKPEPMPVYRVKPEPKPEPMPVCPMKPEPKPEPMPVCPMKPELEPGPVCPMRPLPKPDKKPVCPIKPVPMPIPITPVMPMKEVKPAYCGMPVCPINQKGAETISCPMNKPCINYQNDCNGRNNRGRRCYPTQQVQPNRCCQPTCEPTRMSRNCQTPCETGQQNKCGQPSCNPMQQSKYCQPCCNITPQPKCDQPQYNPAQPMKVCRPGCNQGQSKDCCKPQCGMEQPMYERYQPDDCFGPMDCPKMVPGQWYVFPGEQEKEYAHDEYGYEWYHKSSSLNCESIDNDYGIEPWYNPEDLSENQQGDYHEMLNIKLENKELDSIQSESDDPVNKLDIALEIKDEKEENVCAEDIDSDEVETRNANATETSYDPTVSYVVRAYDTIRTIMEQFGMTMQEVMDQNEPEEIMLQYGSTIRVINDLPMDEEKTE